MSVFVQMQRIQPLTQGYTWVLWELTTSCTQIRASVYTGPAQDDQYLHILRSSARIVESKAAFRVDSYLSFLVSSSSVPLLCLLQGSLVCFHLV